MCLTKRLLCRENNRRSRDKIEEIFNQWKIGVNRSGLSSIHCLNLRQSRRCEKKFGSQFGRLRIILTMMQDLENA